LGAQHCLSINGAEELAFILAQHDLWADLPQRRHRLPHPFVRPLVAGTASFASHAAMSSRSLSRQAARSLCSSM
jgi:hypothetical protein